MHQVQTFESTSDGSLESNSTLSPKTAQFTPLFYTEVRTSESYQTDMIEDKYLGYIQKERFLHITLSPNCYYPKLTESFKSLKTHSLIHEPSIPISLEKRDVKLFTHRSRHAASLAQRASHFSVFNIKCFTGSYTGLSHAPESSNTTSVWYSIPGGAARVQGEPGGWKSCVFRCIKERTHFSTYFKSM